ncbi:DUF5689 domain-containing protein [Croceiramulus getboli]|nr:DUF5689 domain-containing protein [Flavobacteriaceae bacterium YJPT1-3]
MKILLPGLLLLCCTACFLEQDYEVPMPRDIALDLDAPLVTIDAIRGALAQSPNGVVRFTEKHYLEGVVISSDEGGNFFEELIIQDRAENPTAGIAIQIDKNPLFTTYDLGRRIYVDLQGLAATEANGILQLGVPSGIGIDKIPESRVSEVLLRTAERDSLIPLPVTLVEFEDSLENILIELNNVQFRRQDVVRANPLTFASEPGDEFDGFRRLESCDSPQRTLISTSTFSDFKSLQLPRGKGSLSGILTRDFFDEFYVISVNSPEAFVFDQERCDPQELQCEGEASAEEILYYEGFDEIDTNKELEDAGWTNINVAGGKEQFEMDDFAGNNYVRISAFNAGENPVQAWLVSPSIDISDIRNPQLEFAVQAAFDNGQILSAWVSTDFEGDPAAAKWTLLSATIPDGPQAAFGDFELSGRIALDCFEGPIWIGFLYDGGDPYLTTRYHIDQITIYADL